MEYDFYYARCKCAVLAQVKYGILKDEIVKFTIERYLPFKDYGVQSPEGWEFEIDDSSLFDETSYDYVTLHDLKLIRAKEDVDINPRTLMLGKIFQANVIDIDTTDTTDLLEKEDSDND